MLNLKKCFLCGSSSSELISIVNNKPDRETAYFANSNYYREIHKCLKCGVYYNFHDYNLNELYDEKYNKAVYDNDLSIQFNRIMALPKDDSDNKNRVERFVDFCTKNFSSFPDIDILDVGSGLCVFLAELKKFNLNTFCLDPSKIAIDHANEFVGVNGSYCGGFETVEFDRKFDVITFNKVLEHVKSPIEFLNKAKSMLKENGAVYIELPDGDNAIEHDNPVNRQEFFIDHYLIFNQQSLSFLVEKAGFRLIDYKSINEPSQKCTIYGFVR